MITLPAVTVTAARPKPAIRPRRPPRRRAIPKPKPKPRRPTPKRAPPSRAPAPRPAPRPLSKYRPTLPNLLDVLFEESAKLYKKLAPRAAEAPYRFAPTPGAPLEILNAYAPITVEAPRYKPQSFGSLGNPGSPTSYKPPGSKPATDILGKELRRQMKLKKKPTPLTRKKVPGVKSEPAKKAKRGKLEVPDLGPIPKEELQRDPCKQYRQRKRKECPKRGYRLKATAWEKVPCQ